MTLFPSKAKWIAATTLTLAGSAFAQVTVSEPWVRATVPQQKATGAFMTLTATSASRLVQVRSPVAAVVEVHEMSMDNNVMKMRPITGLDLPAGKPVQLKPGGYHVMMIDLKQQMKQGETVPLTLVFEDTDKKQQTVTLDVPIRPLTASADKGESRHEHKH
jgi:periplasmic copper chaperone A